MHTKSICCVEKCRVQPTIWPLKPCSKLCIVIDLYAPQTLKGSTRQNTKCFKIILLDSEETENLNNKSQIKTCWRGNTACVSSGRNEVLDNTKY
jgi:hypothetical protein